MSGENHPSLNSTKRKRKIKSQVATSRTKIQKDKIHDYWLELFSNDEISSRKIRSVLPHFIENVMDSLPNSELFADFLYKQFRQGGYMAVLALPGVFKLIVNHDFDYPNFYQDVYKLLQPNICYSNYAQKFFDLIDLIMTSTHVPDYIICAFTKKLCRILLFAPINCQIPIMQLVKNIISRHSSINFLVNRSEPKTLEADPYNEGEESLLDCGANDSSLWELKAIQNHWHPRVVAKANFVNAHVQDEEKSLGWKTSSEEFRQLMSKSRVKLERTKRVMSLAEYSSQYGPDECATDDSDGIEQFEDTDDQPLTKRGKQEKAMLINELEASDLKMFTTNL